MESSSINLKRMLFNYKSIQTMAIFFSYFSNALNYSVMGPTLVSLSNLYDTSIESISFIYTVRSATYTFGALSGFAFNYLNRQICLIIFTLIMGITLGLMPLMTPLITFFIFGAINGLMAGGSDTAVNAWIIEMWDQSSGPVLNALHFAFGVGSSVAPLIAQPFLTQTQKRLHLTIAYSICASICILSAIFLTVLLFYRKYKADQHLQPIDPQIQQSLPEEIVHESGRYELSPKIGYIIAILGCFLLATYVAMEMTYFSFQSTFVQYSSVNMTESNAAELSSATAAAFTITRGIGVLVALKLSSFTILLCHFMIIMAFNLLMLCLTELPSIWICNIGIGIGCSSVYPTIYAFLQQNFEIDNKKAAIFMFVGGATSSLYPLIVGNLISEKPLVLIYLNISSIISCFILLIIIKTIIIKFKRGTYSFPNTS